MKKILYLLTCIVLLFAVAISCEQSAIEVDEVQTLEKHHGKEKMEKFDLCHWDEELQDYVVISVAEPAYYSHLEQHDMDKPVHSLIGTYVFHYVNESNTWEHDYTIDKFYYDEIEMKWKWSGYGGYKAGNGPDNYLKFELIEGTFNPETGRIEGTTTYYKDKEYSIPDNYSTAINGFITTSPCYGIITFDSDVFSQGYRWELQ